MFGSRNSNSEHLPQRIKARRDINTNSINEGLILQEFGKLLNLLWNEERPFNPIAFHKQVGILKPKFSDYSQQDAMEHLQYLLQHLHQDFNRMEESTENIQTLDQSLDFWLTYCTCETTQIMNNFAGQ
ncbi:USP2 [Cordylochernes scorpioides]|uniref:USP2 n=1 Tax=Cordylochernes scorpioides TaxID=51811 RepID=A0ABY6KIA7_9ARAC|nr:USP2 [Cordylochernes scorpioides]